MVKASPIVRALNAGEFSALMEGRTDLEFYPASMRRANNCILTPQGAVICRSGTKMVVPACEDDETSSLQPFVFNTEQAKVLEFGSDRIRFIDENGIQVYAAQPATITSTTPFKLEIAGLATDVGKELVLSGFPANYNLNGEVCRIVAVAGSEYTLDRDVDASLVGDGAAALVYSVTIDYTEAQRQSIRIVQDVDLVYILCATKRTRKLERFGDYDWRLSDVEFVDGPYLPPNETTTTMTISATGNAVAVMTSNSLPAGNTANGSGKRAVVAAGGTFLGRTFALGLAATDYFHAFDNSDDTYWASDTAQKGTLEYTPAAPFALTGYTLYAPLQNDDVTFLNTDFAPSSWTVEGYDGTNWHVVDRQRNHKLYDNDRSPFFAVNNTVEYTKYRIVITKCVVSGPIEPRIRRWTMRSATQGNITVTASSPVGINKDVGFVATDEGRLLRVYGSDGFWRALRIVSYTSQTVVDCQLLATPFTALDATAEWRLGIWSDTTGWPAAGDLFGERLWLGPSDANPNVLCGSVVGLYENFTHVEEDGTVLDDGAIVHYLKSKQLSRIKWIVSNERGLLAGTGAQEFVIEKRSSTDLNFTQRNIGSRVSTRRGSTDAEPVAVDNRILHVPRSGRAVREMAYSFDANSYVSNNMSRFASHLGVEGFTQQAYSEEPHNIDWILRGDGSVVSLTYNRDEGVVGWGRHDFSSAVVESVVVIPSPDQQQDTLWLQTRRTINGQTRRFIEFVTRAWDFGMTLNDAWYVDCGIGYDGVATTVLYGAQHLEGEDVYGVGRAGAGTSEDPYVYLTFGPLTVTNGTITLESEVTHAVFGLGFDSEGETSRLENGAADGTAQGKVKRLNNASIMVWDTSCGELAVYDDNSKEFKFTPIEFTEDAYDELQSYKLHTSLLAPSVLDAAYSTRGSISFRRPKALPLPFNIVAIMPGMRTYDP